MSFLKGEGGRGVCESLTRKIPRASGKKTKLFQQKPNKTLASCGGIFNYSTYIPFSRLLSHIKVKLSTHKVQVSYIAFELSTFRFRISNISIRFSWIAFHGSILTIGSSKYKIQFSSYEKLTFHNLNSNFQFQRWIFQYNKMNFPQLKFNFKHLFFIFPCLYFSLVYKFHIDHE